MVFKIPVAVQTSPLSPTLKLVLMNIRSSKNGSIRAILLKQIKETHPEITLPYLKEVIDFGILHKFLQASGTHRVNFTASGIQFLCGY